MSVTRTADIVTPHGSHSNPHSLSPSFCRRGLHEPQGWSAVHNIVWESVRVAQHSRPSPPAVAHASASRPKGICYGHLGIVHIEVKTHFPCIEKFPKKFLNKLGTP
jgi:hypothetical protein